MRTKLKGILHQPGFPSDVSFAEVDCFNDRNMNDLRTKLKGLIDRYVNQISISVTNVKNHV